MENSTAIINLSEFNNEENKNKSILDKINGAKNKSDVLYYLGIGKSYKKVSNGTVNKWNRAAAKKIASLKD